MSQAHCTAAKHTTRTEAHPLRHHISQPHTLLITQSFSIAYAAFGTFQYQVPIAAPAAKRTGGLYTCTEAHPLERAHAQQPRLGVI